MCWCNPTIKTPNCGRTACHPPVQVVQSTIDTATHPVSAIEAAKRPMVQVELDASLLHLSYLRAAIEIQATFERLRQFCRDHNILVDRYRFDIEAIGFLRRCHKCGQPLDDCANHGCAPILQDFPKLP